MTAPNYVININSKANPTKQINKMNISLNLQSLSI